MHPTVHFVERICMNATKISRKCKFIAKPNTWFDEGTEVILTTQINEDGLGIFRGIRTCKNPKSENRKLGEKYVDEELCSFDEFELRREE